MDPNIPKYSSVCILCRDHMKGKKEGRIAQKKINLEEKGEGLCRLCETKICEKNTNLSICQAIRQLKMENPQEKIALEELENELENLPRESSPPPSNEEIAQALKRMSRDIEEEDEFKKLERQVQVPRKLSSPKKKKGLFSKLFGK